MTTMIKSMVARRSGLKGLGGALYTVTGDWLCWCWCLCGSPVVVVVVDENKGVRLLVRPPVGATVIS